MQTIGMKRVRRRQWLNVLIALWVTGTTQAVLWCQIVIETDGFHFGVSPINCCNDAKSARACEVMARGAGSTKSMT